MSERKKAEYDLAFLYQNSSCIEHRKHWHYKNQTRNYRTFANAVYRQINIFDMTFLNRVDLARMHLISLWLHKFGVSSSYSSSVNEWMKKINLQARQFACLVPLLYIFFF